MIDTVVHFLDSDTFGGCEAVVLSLLAGLDRSRWKPILFHYDAPGITRLLNEVNQLGISCRVVPRMTGKNKTNTLIQFCRQLSAAKPTVFHAHLNWPLACRYGLVAAKLSRVPAIVATSHLYFPVPVERFGRLKQHLQASLIDRYIAVSNEVKKRLCNDLGITELKVRVVHNGIQLAPFDVPTDSNLRGLLVNGHERPIVFTPARLHPQKGHTYLLEAAAQIPDALFVLAGDGPDRDSIKQLVRRLGLEARVRFLGQRQDIPQLLASCDLFVLPSLYEGLPISVLEAMAAGKPVIATATGGTDEAVVNGSTGILVPPGNSTELAAAIRRLLTDRGLAAQFGAAGRSRAKQMFSSDSMVCGVTRVYDELIKKKR